MSFSEQIGENTVVQIYRWILYKLAIYWLCWRKGWISCDYAFMVAKVIGRRKVVDILWNQPRRERRYDERQQS